MMTVAPQILKLKMRIEPVTSVLILDATLNSLADTKYARRAPLLNTMARVANAKYMYVGQVLESFAQAVR